MDIWVERFNNHVAWDALAEVRTRLNALEIDPENPTESRSLAYHGAVLEDLESRRAETDPLFINTAMLSSLHAALNQWRAALADIATGSRTCESTLPEVEQVVSALSAWPPVRPARYFAGVWAAATSYQEKVESVLGRFAEEAAETEARLGGLEERTTALTSSIDREKQRIAEAIAEFTSASTGTVNSEVDVIRGKAEAIISRLADHEVEVGVTFTETLEYLDDLKKKAAETVNAATAEVVATDYGKYARNKTWAAWITDVAAGAVGIAGVSAILLHLYTLDESADDLGVSITRLAASLGTVGIAALIGRRAAQHHAEARAAKRTDLAIRRVLPFIATLDEDERKAIILEISDRVFIAGKLEPESSSAKSSLQDRIREVASRRKAGEAPQGNQ